MPAELSALVTGASRGIGFAIAEPLGRGKFALTLTSRDAAAGLHALSAGG